jgi:hypothetical protein
MLPHLILNRRQWRWLRSEKSDFYSGGDSAVCQFSILRAGPKKFHLVCRVTFLNEVRPLMRCVSAVQF